MCGEVGQLYSGEKFLNVLVSNLCLLYFEGL
jgi:hypothetical protein